MSPHINICRVLTLAILAGDGVLKLAQVDSVDPDELCRRHGLRRAVYFPS